MNGKLFHPTPRDEGAEPARPAAVGWNTRAEPADREEGLRHHYRTLGRLVLIATIVIGIGSSATAYRIAASRALRAVQSSAREALALQSEALNGVLDKYRLLPPILSHRADIVALFDNPADPTASDVAHIEAARIAGYSGAKDVTFSDPEGRVFASARGAFDGSRIQRSTLLEAVQQGRLGREAMSLEENDRTYVFASAVRRGSEFVGVIAVYVDFYRIESTWSLSANPIIVTDAKGIVFLGNRNAWRRRPFEGGDNPVVEAVSGTGGLFVRQPGGPTWVADQRKLPILGWTLNVLESDQPIETAGRTAALLALLVTVLAGGIVWLFVKRGEAHALKAERDRLDALRLERLVDERTSALTRANASLAYEVAERAETEERLRRTQKELVQTAKLAALGQMSATLSHEYNQPLAAIRTHADNAVQLLHRGRTETAVDALVRITSLVDRMSELSRALLSFARRPGTEIQEVLLAPVIDEALMLVGPRARKAGIAIRKSALEPDLKVLGGRIRLTQVVVNLLNNAIDALTGIGAAVVDRRPEIVIEAREMRKYVVLSIDDNGPGIPSADRERIFEPFYSTKGVGEGLGIGLSIVYNVVTELGGTVAATDSTSGGARISVRLKGVRAVKRKRTSREHERSDSLSDR